MSDTAPRVEDPSHWDDTPFVLAPLPFRSRAWRELTNLFCLLGMAIAKCARALWGNRDATVPQKILVIRRGGLGDILMATPLLRGLREHFPSARIYVLASTQALSGLAGCSWVDQILEVPASKKDWLLLLYRLRKERIDTAFILHRFFPSHQRKRSYP